MRASLVFIAAILATPALAAEPPTVERAVSAARAPLTTAEQIDAYLKTSPALELGDEPTGGVTLSDDRQPHGEIAIGIGTQGYRSVYARTDLPVGKTGRFSFAFEDSRFEGRSGSRRYGNDLGRSSPFDRQRCDLEAMNPVRPLDVIGGPNGRCPSTIIAR